MKHPSRARAAGVAAAAMLLITACGTQGGSPEASASGSEVEPRGTITFAGFGGAYHDALERALYIPFEEATGIHVEVVPAESTMGDLKAQVESGNVLWDMVQLSDVDTTRACGEGLLEEIEWSQIDTTDVIEGGELPCGLLAAVFTRGIGYDPTVIEEPPTWEDYYDLEKYPGNRAEVKFLLDGPLEVALLADGVAREDLYPLDVDRALNKIESLGENVIFVDSLAQSSQLLASGEAVMVHSAIGRILALQAAGINAAFAPIGKLGRDFYTIPAGAPNADLAMEFLKFAATCAECSADQAKLLAYAGPNARAVEFLSEEEAALMPTDPTIQENTYVLDLDYWVENAEEVQLRWTEFLVSNE